MRSLSLIAGIVIALITVAVSSFSIVTPSSLSSRPKCSSIGPARPGQENHMMKLILLEPTAAARQQEERTTVATTALSSSVGTEGEEAAPVAAEEEKESEEEVAAVADEVSAAVDNAEVSTDTDEEASAAAPADEKRSIQRERHTAFVGNVPFDADESDLKQLFEGYGSVELVTIPKNRDDGMPRGFAFVDMGSAEQLDAVVEELNATLFAGRKIYVTKSADKEANKGKERQSAGFGETKKLYVGNIPYMSSEEEMFDLFAELGEVLAVQIPKHSDSGRGRGFCFITVKAEDEEKILDASQDLKYDGRKIVVNKPLPMGEKRPRGKNAQTQNRKRIYVGNLSFYTLPETVSEIFGEFGEVLDCYMPTDRNTGSSRGFGFVTMGPEDAENAIEELNGCEVDGRTIVVNEAQEMRRSSYNDSTMDAEDEEEEETPAAASFEEDEETLEGSA